MQKSLKRLIFLAVFLIILIIPYLVFAKDAPVAGTESGAMKNLSTVADKSGYAVSGTDNRSLSKIIGRIVGVALSFLGVIFVCLALYGGFLWMTAQGNDDQVGKAKNIIKNSIIGLVIVVSSFAIWNLVRKPLMGEPLYDIGVLAE